MSDSPAQRVVHSSACHARRGANLGYLMRMWKTWMCAATLVVAGCSKKADDAGGGAVAAGAGACGDAAKGVDQLMAKAGGGGGPMTQRGDQLKSIIVKHCSDDKWAADVIDCYAKASSMPELKTCRGKLPAEQSQRLQGEIMQAMMSGSAGNSPPH